MKTPFNRQYVIADCNSLGTVRNTTLSISYLSNIFSAFEDKFLTNFYINFYKFCT